MSIKNKHKFLATYGNSDHIEHVLNHSNDEETVETAANNPSLGENAMNKLVNSPKTFRRITVSQNPNLKKEHLDKLVNDPEEEVRIGLTQNPRLKKEHIDKLLKDDSHWVLPDLIGGPHKHRISHEQASAGLENLKRLGSHFVDLYKRDAKEIHGHDL